jgi:hypothetical protein
MSVNYRRVRFVLGLPKHIRMARSYDDCAKSRVSIGIDLLTLFFSYKTYPDHYGLCRLWEVDKKEWKYYYGSNFHPPQSARLSKELQPLDYRILFDDKYLTCILCRQLGIRIPFTYGVINPRQDYRAQIISWFETSSADSMIIKPRLGAMGRDIVLARKDREDIVIQSGNQFIALDLFVLKESSIVQKVMRQDSRMSMFSSSSVNTVRMLTMLTRDDDFMIVNASFRSGVGSAFVDNWSAGGLSVGVDCARGVLKQYAYDKKSRRHTTHPTTGVVFEDYPVPEWDRICRMAETIQRAFFFYRSLGLDIAVDQDRGPVLIEANAAPDIAGLEQKAGPLLKNETVLIAFGEYDLLYNDHQRAIYRKLKGMV